MVSWDVIGLQKHSYFYWILILKYFILWENLEMEPDKYKVLDMCTITATARCGIFLLLRNVIQSVSFTWHLGLVLVIIPSHSFPTREASQFSTLVTAVLAKCPAHTPPASVSPVFSIFFVVMMIESAEFLSVFIAVIRSDVSTVPVTDQSMTYHNTMYYMYIVHTLRSTAYGGLRMTVFKKEREI